MKTTHLLVILFSIPAYSSVIRIPADYSSIQQGINSAVNGDTVLVAPGIYFENINFNAKNITVASHYIISENTLMIGQTIIDGSDSGSVIPLNGSVVTFENGEDSTALLCGFTLTGGTGNLRALGFHSFYHGGGIYCYNSSPQLKRLRIMANSSELGGGIFMYNSNSTVSFCELSKDTCLSAALDAPLAGGGIALWNCNHPLLANLKITENYTGYAAGAIYSLFSSPIVTNSLIAGNYTETLGSAIYADTRSDVQLINCTVYGNDVIGFMNGGVIYCIDSIDLKIRNCIFRNNIPGIIVCQGNYGAHSITVSHTNFPGRKDSIITNGNAVVNWLSGNTDTLPNFVNEGLGDFRLMSTSPCINAGDTLGISGLIPPFDLNGQIRIVQTIDMGAYELPFGLGIGHNDRRDFQVFPNPTNGLVTIIWDATEYSTRVLSLYRSDGRHIKDISTDHEEKTQIGFENLPDGIYLLKCKGYNTIKLVVRREPR